jgi:hypothetical protein
MYRVSRVPRGGGTLTTVATLPQADVAENPTHAVTTDGTNVYWLASQCLSDGGQFCDTIAVMKAPVGGGPASVIATTEGVNYDLSIAVDATYVYFTLQVPSCKPDGSCDPNTVPGPVMKAPIAGGQASMVATGGMARGIAVDATSLYWLDFECGGGMCLKRLQRPQ